MKFSEELVARGYISQFSAPSLSEIIDDKKRVIYHGIDPSADSAHAGNFVNWMLLRHLVKNGHKVVFLVGGGTGLIGDPKPDAERTLSSQEEVAIRVEKLKNQAKRLLKDENIEFVNNYDWLSSLSLLGFLRDIGKNFTVNELIKKEAISRRLETENGLSYTEFAYPLLQAYDYLILNRERGCDLQVGGSDQWGNIIAGVDLVRRMEQKTVYAITVPLVIDKTTGKKFGKSEGNAVWLDETKTSPYNFYQFWFNVADENVIDYLKLFTDLDLAVISEIEQTLISNPGGRVAQKILAKEVTTIVHGADKANLSERISECLFGDRKLSELGVEEVEALIQNAPYFEIADQANITDVLVAVNLATSKREARTFIESGAIYKDGEKITDVNLNLDKVSGPLVQLKRGKKQVAIVKISK